MDKGCSGFCRSTYRITPPYPNFGSLWSVLALAAFLCAQVTISPAVSVNDLAEVYVHRYIEPDLSTELSTEGQSRADALAHYAVGTMLDNAGDTDEAIQRYLSVLELQPSQLDLARRVSQMLARSGQQAQGRHLLEGTLKNNTDQAFAYVILSEFLSTYHNGKQDNKDRALSLAKDAVEKFPTEVIGYKHLGGLYLLSKRRDDIRTMLDKALTVEQTNPYFWLQLGDLSRKAWLVRGNAGEIEQTINKLNRFYSKALAHAGSDDYVNERVGDFYHQSQQHDNAENIFRSIIDRNTDRLDVRRKLARVYHAQGNIVAYIDTLKKIIKIDPKDVQTHQNLAKAYAGINDIPNSLKHRRSALRIGKGSSDDYLKLADDMIQQISKISIDEREAELKDIVSFIKEAAYRFPNRPEFLLYITGPLGALSQHKDAVKFFQQYEEKVKKKSPERLNARFHFKFGASLERAGDIEKAAERFRTSIKKIGQQSNQEENQEFTAEVYNYLGYMWIENDMKIDEGGELIKEAFDLDPTNYAIADSLGWFYFKKEKYKEALEALLKSEDLIKKAGYDVDPVIADHIGQVYHALGDHEKAVQYMELTVKEDKEGKQEFIDRLAEYRKALEQSKQQTQVKEEPVEAP